MDASNGLQPHPPEEGRPSGRALWLPVLFLLLPALHPLVRPAMGVASHLAWFAHVLPVALVTYRFGRLEGTGVLLLSAGLVLGGERLFGAGYGRPAPWATAGTLAASLAFANGLVAGFADAARRAMRRLRFTAYHDSVTGLPNRALFMRRLERAMDDRVGEDAAPFAVLFLDLDRFKLLNDSLGHSVGDDLLDRAARRLEECVRPEDVVARWGGDEFLFFVEPVEGPEEALSVAQRVRDAVGRPFRAGGHEVVLTGSVGVTLGPADYEEAGELVRDADTAMYRAKEAGEGGVQLFDREMHQEITDRLELEHGLRRALEGDDFEIHYQPLVSLPEGCVSGFEALVRWRHPDRGLVPPGEFIPVAEESGLIVPVGDLVLREACDALNRWRGLVEGSPVMAVNVSPRQLTRADFADRVREITSGCGTSTGELILEVTETDLLAKEALVDRPLERLRDAGIRIALDDFGTEYSSLAYLHRLPVDYLKIDRSFLVDGAFGDAGGSAGGRAISASAAAGREREDGRDAILRSIVGLARELDVRTVAEGVETEQQRRAVEALGCDFAQGYRFARPLPEDEVQELLADPASCLVDGAAVSAV